MFARTYRPKTSAERKGKRQRETEKGRDKRAHTKVGRQVGLVRLS